MIEPMLIDDLSIPEQAMAVCILVIALGVLGMIACAAEWLAHRLRRVPQQTMPVDWVPARDRRTHG